MDARLSLILSRIPRLEISIRLLVPEEDRPKVLANPVAGTAQSEAVATVVTAGVAETTTGANCEVEGPAGPAGEDSLQDSLENMDYCCRKDSE